MESSSERPLSCELRSQRSCGRRPTSARTDCGRRWTAIRSTESRCAIETFEQARWIDAWRRVGATPPQDLHVQLIGRYSEPHRAYHTLRHLAECFAALDQTTHLAERSAEVELALWFHDAIYDTRASDCEEQSARWAEQALTASGADAAIAQRVTDLILLTKHSGIPVGVDARLLIDIDLSILAATAERFAEYELQVRQEYDWVPEAAFRQARKRILASFRERPCVYGTPWFAERFEARARENLARSLRALDAPSNDP